MSGNLKIFFKYIIVRINDQILFFYLISEHYIMYWKHMVLLTKIFPKVKNSSLFDVPSWHGRSWLSTKLSIVEFNKLYILIHFLISVQLTIYTNSLGRWFAASPCLNCLHYILWVSKSPSLLSSSCPKNYNSSVLILSNFFWLFDHM